MRALVLGGNGFIGSHLVDALLGAGAQVRVFDRGPERFRAPLRKVDYRLFAINDTANLAEALSDIDVVFHLISTTVPATSNLDPVADIEGNLIPTVRLLELMARSGVKRLVYLSSGGTVYGVPEVSPIPEDHALRPISSYGIVKVAVENYMMMAQSLAGIEPVILRASNPFGPRQGRQGVQGVIGTFLWKLAQGAPLEIWGDGKVVRDFIYVEDLAALCLKSATGPTGEIFNAGSGTGHSILEIIDAMRVATGQDITPQMKLGRPFDVPRAVLDITRVQAALGWAPAVSLADGMAKTWDWVQAEERKI